MTVREDLEYRQSMGAEFLDEHSPGWRSLIVRPVRIEDSKNCIGGQLSGDYFVFLNWVTEKIDDLEGRWRSADGELVDPPGQDWDWAEDHGFYCGDGYEADILNELWTIEVESGDDHE